MMTRGDLWKRFYDAKCKIVATEEVIEMRAKMVINEVKRVQNLEMLSMTPVAKPNGYDELGLDEDNTYAKFSPSGQLTLTIANPALFGKFNPGEKYYLDFTKAE